MKHLMYDRGFDPFSRIDIQKIKQLAEELGQFGSDNITFPKSGIPRTIFGRVILGNEIKEDKSNHAITEIDETKTIEFFRRIFRSFRRSISIMKIAPKTYRKR